MDPQQDFDEEEGALDAHLQTKHMEVNLGP
jgi:hypothetical protein